MNIENYLKKLKADYLKAEPSRHFLDWGWEDLQEKIEHLEKVQFNRAIFYLRPVAFAVIAIFIFSGTFAGLARASQRSLPGEPLYPIKRLSEDIISTARGNSLIKVDNRAKEIVDLTKKGEKNEDNLSRTIEEYREEVEKVSKSGKDNKELEETLESHEREFEEIKENNSGSNSGEEIDEAIEISKSGRDTKEDEEEDKQEAEDRENEDRSDTNSGEN